MQTIVNIAQLRHVTHNYRKEDLRIAFVPTMGNLHEGHLSLIEKAKLKADRVVVSIFVNPLQFAPNEDFHAYPRTLAQDSLMLAESGTHLLFLPDIKELYPHSLDQHTRVIVPTLSDELCGAFRPLHFCGVATIVTKLLNIVQPDVAIFGEKDYQQLVIIRKIVNDLCLPIEICGAPTVRASDGLAMSSRNQYLSNRERQIAPKLYQKLIEIRNGILTGDRNYETLCQKAMQDLSQLGFKPDYIDIRNTLDLQPASREDNSIIILGAAYLGKTRLIDNLICELT